MLLFVGSKVTLFCFFRLLSPLHCHPFSLQVSSPPITWLLLPQSSAWSLLGLLPLAVILSRMQLQFFGHLALMVLLNGCLPLLKAPLCLPDSLQYCYPLQQLICHSKIAPPKLFSVFSTSYGHNRVKPKSTNPEITKFCWGSNAFVTLLWDCMLLRF